MKKPARKSSPKKPPMALPLRVGLFALMFLAVVMMGTRIRDIVIQIASGETPSAFAPLHAAEDTKPDATKIDAPAANAKKADDKKPDDKKPEDTKPADVKAEVKEEQKKVEPVPAAAKPSDAKTDAKPTEAAAKDSAKPADAVKPAAEATVPDVEDPSLDGPELSEAEVNVLRHLSRRRKDLDKKSAELDQRETLLNVTEQRVDKKITDLKQMQVDIRKVLGEADAEHKAQVASMVKIYETMKAKDAAHIFEGMDTPTLVEVVSRMKEAKAAPVLAAMNPAKAKEVSIALMEKKKLPATP